MKLKMPTPSKKKKKHQHLSNIDSKTLESHLKTNESYFIKWTTSCEPQVGSGSLSDFYLRSTKLLLSD